MATTLANAYVQIIPSAEGISGRLDDILEPEASSAGDRAGKSAGSGFVGSVKKIIAAAGIGAVIKESISAGADLEQSIGGIETLFGDGAATMLTKANDAYKTAGLSANEYMQTVTGFAASLKQSVGGDMETLTSVADQAVIDMADNANKMGTDMGAIQNAYAGFAKQNYTMLDNLKLGYGGTKKEMERLLADATALSGVEYDLESLSDVYSAIHVIQDELGITGTTALEASETLSGSLASMKASFENVLGTLTTGGDVAGAMQGLLDSAFTFLNNNLVPMLTNLISAIPDLLYQLVTSLVTNAPQLAQSAFDIVNALWEGLKTTMEQFVTGEDSFVKVAINHITDNLPEFLQKGVDTITSFVNGFLESLPQVIEGVGELVITFVDTIGDWLPTILTKGAELVLNLVTGIVNNLPQIVQSAVQIITKLIATIAEHLPEIIETGIKMIGQLVVGLIKAIPEIIKAIPQIISSIKESFANFDWRELGRNIIEGIKNGLVAAGSAIWNALKDICAEALQGVKNFFKIGSPSKVMADEVGKWLPSGIAVGAEKNTAPLTDAMQTMADTAVNGVNSGLVSDLSVSAKSASRVAVASDNGMYEMLSEYLPVIAEKCGVTLSPSASGIFNLVKEENRKFVKSTGVRPLMV